MANNIEGEFLYKDLIPGDLDLRGSTPSLQGEEQQLFLEFVGKMLRWVPEDRKTAKELLQIHGSSETRHQRGEVV